MKKSEFERARTALWKGNLQTSTETAEVILMVMRDGEAAEAAGVTWDPEEPEEASRLRLGLFCHEYLYELRSVATALCELADGPATPALCSAIRVTSGRLKALLDHDLGSHQT